MIQRPKHGPYDMATFKLDLTIYSVNQIFEIDSNDNAKRLFFSGDTQARFSILSVKVAPEGNIFNLKTYISILVNYLLLLYLKIMSFWGIRSDGVSYRYS